MMKLSHSLLLSTLTLGNAVTGSVIAKRELCGQYQSQSSGLRHEPLGRGLRYIWMAVLWC
jgi:hypothetical protein